MADWLNETQRALLDALADGPVSGPVLADDHGVSRAAVWKAVEALREQGFRIESTGSGYEITEVPEYGAGAIEYGLEAPYTVEFHESLGSTNDRAREIAAEGIGGGDSGDERSGPIGDAENIVVVADEQTGGRGRLNRAWSAPAGGVWLSLVLRPDRPPAHVPLFTMAAAVATTRACREAGVDAGIKWPNDVLVEQSDDAATGDGGEPAERGGLKLAGILTEMEGEADRVSWLVVGIGVNANVDTADLPAGATSLQCQRGSAVDRRLFVQRLLEEFHTLRESPETVLPAWRAHATTIGQRVRVDTPSGVVEGEAVDVTHPGALVVRTESGDVTVHAGDCEHLRPA